MTQIAVPMPFFSIPSRIIYISIIYRTINIHIMNENHVEPEFKVYPKRFLVTGLFALAELMVAVVLHTLTPIAAYLTDIYDQDAVTVNLGSLLCALMHPIFTFPASFVIDTYGTRAGILIGSIFAIVGLSLRLLINEWFFVVVIGQIIGGIGRPFIVNCQAKISANWFTAQVRGGVTQLLALVLDVFLILGVLIPGLFFHGYDPDGPDSIEDGKNRTFNLMIFQFFMGLVCFVPNIFLQSNKPPTPPSQSSSVQREPFKQALSKIIKNKNYILLLLAFGCYFGIFNAISIVLSFLIKPWFNDNLPLAVGVIGGSPIISGILGVIIIGPIQRKSGQFKKWIMICMIGSLATMLLFYPLLETNSLFLASFISAINSFFLIPLAPIMLELGCELVFPVGEGSAVGLLFAMKNFSGFLLGLIMSTIIKGETKQQTLYGFIFCAGVYAVGFVLVYFMKEIKNRENVQKQISGSKRSEGSNSLMIGDDQKNAIDDTTRVHKQKLLERQEDDE